MKINWIHFSDFHLGNDSAVDTKLMRERLPQFILSLNRKYDYAFCSGDIKEWSSDFSAAPEYLRNLCDASNTPLEHLFVAQGNYDINIDRKDRKRLIKKITNWKTDYYTSTNGIIKEMDLELLRSGESEFVSFINELFGADRAALYSKPHFVIKTEHFNILQIDSTITYCNGVERDFVIGTGAFKEALEDCDKSLPTIVLTHYSYDYLSRDEQNQIETLMSDRKIDLWLAGHEHQNLIRLQRDKFYECQCGNLKLEHGARSCFLTGEIDLETGAGVIMVYAWFEGKGWERYPFARVGADDNYFFPFALRRQNDDRVIASFELSNARDACKRLALTGSLFHNVNVNESLFPDLECEGIIFENIEKVIPLISVMEHLWQANDTFGHALLLGDGGMGKSTMMYYACCKLNNKRILSVYVSLQSGEGAGNKSLIDIILYSLYKSTDERAKSKFITLTSECHTRPDLVLFIDGFNELSGEGAQFYASQIKELIHYPGIQIVVSSRMDFLRDYGLRYFSLIRTRGLREEQLYPLFSSRQADWDMIIEHRELRILVQNPMMALIFANTCPVIDDNKDIDYLEWITPVTNSSELLFDYFLSQIAVLAGRQLVDGKRIFTGFVAVEIILTKIAWLAERSGKMYFCEEEFEAELIDAVNEANKECFENKMPPALKKIKRKMRVHVDRVSQDDLYEIIVNEMCLMKSGNGMISFPHQIYRDYLAAVYLYDCLNQNINTSIWHNEEIHKCVIQYIKHLERDTLWGKGGKINTLLSSCRDHKLDESDKYITNVVNCWISEGDGERDLSRLDLRSVSLAKHLKSDFNGTINIDNAWVEKTLFVNDKFHDKIIAISFSHDNNMMAAVSENGLVSVTNLKTSSQMIVKELEPDMNVTVGFDSEDSLIIKNSHRTYKWTSFLYDSCEDGNIEDIISLENNDKNQKKVDKLKSLLDNSDIAGVYGKCSENGKYYAVGYENGFIHVWDTDLQECVANLSLSDSRIAAASFTKDGRFAAIGSGGKLVQIWNVVKGTHYKTLFFEQRVSGVSFPENDLILVCAFSNGTFCKTNIITGEISEIKKSVTKPFVSKALSNRIKNAVLYDISPKGSAIFIDKNGNAFTWCQPLKTFHGCGGHRLPVTMVAICKSDDRFAASYSNERYRATKSDRNRKGLLNGKRLVRVRIVKTGQCQWRLPLEKDIITKLQFFTSNRIVLAGFTSNGDIILWELINRFVKGQERGSWNYVKTVMRNHKNPLECAITSNKELFISAYANGEITARSFNDSNNIREIKTFPGINAEVFKWDDLKCPESLKSILSGYDHIL